MINSEFIYYRKFERMMHTRLQALYVLPNLDISCLSCVYSDEVGKEGYGHRFYSASRNHAQYRELRSTLLEHCRKLQTYITALESQDWAEKVGVNDPSDAKRDTLRSYYPRCLKYVSSNLVL